MLRKPSCLRDTEQEPVTGLIEEAASMDEAKAVGILFAKWLRRLPDI